MMRMEEGIPGLENERGRMGKGLACWRDTSRPGWLGKGSKLRTEGKRGQLWKAFNSRLGERVESSELSEQGSDRTKPGRGGTETEQLLNIQGDHQDLSLRGVTRAGDPALPPQPYALRTLSSLPFLQYVRLPCLGNSCVSPGLWQLFSGLASFITQLPVLKRPSLTAPPSLFSVLVSYFIPLLH